MEKKLTRLFDYQRFENNARLSKIIAATEAKYATQLSEDDLFLVNAAGETDAATDKRDKKNL